ncbi:Right handed beta helix domain containing protein [Acidimicrobiia bacterium]
MESLLGGAVFRHRSGRVVALGSTAVLAAAGAGPLVMLTSTTASANTTLVVSTLADSGAGSLRQAMLDANSAAGVDTITFTAGLTGTINVLSDLPWLDGGIDLQGPGASVITIDGGWAENDANLGHTLFVLDNLDVADGASTISGVTITGGNGTDNKDNSGGAIQKLYGDADLTIADVVLTGNYSANDGGAVHLYNTGGTVTIRDSVISNNVAYYSGGALYSGGDGALTLILTNVEITGNTAGDGDGGGLYLEETDTTISNSTIDGNVSEGNGGGISSGTGSLTISNSTIDGNVSEGNGGGIFLYYGSLTISNTTISGNEGFAGGGIYAKYLGSDLDIINSTISGNRSTSEEVGVGGGGILLNDADAVLIQSTVTANSSDATYAVGGIQSRGSGPGEYDLTLIGSIVAGNDDLDIGGSVNGSNVSVFSECSVLGVIDPDVSLTDDGGTQVGVTDPMLGLLANNGGITKTHALLAGSPAIDAGPDPIFVFDGNEFDQRGVGFARIVFGVVDAGAFEMQEPEPETTTTTTTAPTTTTTTTTNAPVVPAFTG